MAIMIKILMMTRTVHRRRGCPVNRCNRRSWGTASPRWRLLLAHSDYFNLCSPHQLLELFQPYYKYCAEQTSCQQYCKEQDRDNQVAVNISIMHIRINIIHVKINNHICQVHHSLDHGATLARCSKRTSPGVRLRGIAIGWDSSTSWSDRCRGSPSTASCWRYSYCHQNNDDAVHGGVIITIFWSNDNLKMASSNVVSWPTTMLAGCSEEDWRPCGEAGLGWDGQVNMSRISTIVPLILMMMVIMTKVMMVIIIINPGTWRR